MTNKLVWDVPRLQFFSPPTLGADANCTNGTSIAGPDYICQNGGIAGGDCQGTGTTPGGFCTDGSTK